MVKLKEEMRKRLLKAKGFTLVELLVVIMIIAILAGMLLLATGNANDTATAARIVNDLRGIKSATLLVIADKGYSPDDFVEPAPGVDPKLDPYDVLFQDLGRYTDRDFFHMPDSIDEKFVYTFMPLVLNVEIKDTGQKKFMIGFDLSAGGTRGVSVTPGVIKKLADMAEKSGLYNDDGELFTANDVNVYMVCF